VKTLIGRTIVFYIGPVPISSTIVTTWAIMLLLVVLSWVLVSKKELYPSGVRQLPEIFVLAIDGAMSNMIGPGYRQYFPFVCTVALFVTASNLAGVFPGVTPPTSDLSTVAAVGTLVFLVAHVTGILTKGIKRYLAEYFEPSWWLFPINFVGVLSRPLSHIFRLYGNMIGGGILVSVANLLAPWIIPIPVTAWFSVFVGLVQGVVFTMLTIAYIAEAGVNDRRFEDDSN